MFEYATKWNPDVDDTAMVLLALRQIATDHPAKRDECFARLKWMMTFQCKDGGWAAFDKDCTKTFWKGSVLPTTTPCSTRAPISPRASPNYWLRGLGREAPTGES